MVKLNASGGGLQYATFLGGESGDLGVGIAVDGSGAAYVSGWTESSDFPTTPGAFDRSYNGWGDAFVAKFDIAPPPDNDDFDEAVVIPSSAASFQRIYAQNTTNATTAWDDPEFTCVSGQKHHTVWYRFTPQVAGVLTLDTNGSDYDTVLAVWRGGRGNLISVGCDDDGGEGVRSYLQVNVNANVTYHIEVAGYHSDESGNLRLRVAFQPTDELPPSISNVRESNDPINREGCFSPTTSVIRADVSDASGLAWVRLYYRPPGSSAWQYKTMSRESGDTYKAALGPFSGVGSVRYYIKARDNAGNERSTSTYTLAVEECDVTGPEITNIVVDPDVIAPVGCEGVNVARVVATVHDPSGVEWVRLEYRESGQLWRYVRMTRISVSEPIYEAYLGPFETSGRVEYRIWARDLRGNERRTAIAALTVRECDVTPPSIENVYESVDPINRFGCPGLTQAKISAEVSDESGLAWVRIYVQVFQSEFWQFMPMNHESGDTYAATLGPFNDVGQVRYFIQAEDAEGNRRSSPHFTLSVSDCPSFRMLLVAPESTPSDAPVRAYIILQNLSRSSYDIEVVADLRRGSELAARRIFSRSVAGNDEITLEPDFGLQTTGSYALEVMVLVQGEEYGRQSRSIEVLDASAMALLLGYEARLSLAGYEELNSIERMVSRA